jgi:4-hydroxy-tetrahydrodipicolinate synthase
LSTRISGVLAPVVTPFTADHVPDGARLARHCRWLVANGAGLAVFGTNSEANSMAVGERMELLDMLVESGVDPAWMMPGTGACAVPDVARATAQAVRLGCAGVLMLPPFYYKGVSDEGLYRYYAEVIARVADARLRIYLYHIPPVSQVPVSLALIERLLKDFPGIVAGVKDSSGDWSNTSAMLERFAPAGFDVFAGSEVFLLANMRGGGVGCISATANVNPAAIAALHRGWRGDDAPALQAGLDRVRTIFQKYPMVAALKHAVAHWSDDPAWRTVRPPLTELTAAQGEALVADLDAAGFSMPGLARPVPA